MSSATDIGVVVVTYQSMSTIERCLMLLLACPTVAKLIVIDNASGDGTPACVEAIAKQHPRVRLVRNRENRGFGAACNQGASALDTPWVAFVNPDIYIERDSLLRLVTHARTRPGAGVLGVDMVGEQGLHDPAARRCDPSLRELFLRGGQRDAWYVGRDPKLDLQSVEAISGALMLMPLGLFLKVGGFDEDYRLHVEDLDLCRRVRAAGYEVLVANDVTVTHLRGVSSRSRPMWVEWQKHRSLWRYFLKFEAAQTPSALRAVLWLGLWSHFALSALRVLLARGMPPPVSH